MNNWGLSNPVIAKELGRAPQNIHSEIKDVIDETVRLSQDCIFS